MLIVSKTRYVPTAVNMIVLQGKDDYFYYLHRSLYDQCVILRDQYLHLLPSFYKLLGFDGAHPAVCDTFMERAPEPMDILGPLLTLVTGCEQLETIEDMCGALSSMSMSIDFRRMFKVPVQVRQSIKFSLSVREEYRVQWDRFFLETPEFAQISLRMVRTQGPMEARERGEIQLPEEEDINEIVYTGDVAYNMDDLLAQMNEWEEAEKEVDGAEAPSAEKEVEETPKSGFAMLRGL